MNIMYHELDKHLYNKNSEKYSSNLKLILRFLIFPNRKRHTNKKCKQQKSYMGNASPNATQNFRQTQHPAQQLLNNKCQFLQLPFCCSTFFFLLYNPIFFVCYSENAKILGRILCGFFFLMHTPKKTPILSYATSFTSSAHATSCTKTRRVLERK